MVEIYLHSLKLSTSGPYPALHSKGRMQSSWSNDTPTPVIQCFEWQWRAMAGSLTRWLHLYKVTCLWYSRLSVYVPTSFRMNTTIFSFMTQTIGVSHTSELNGVRLGWMKILYIFISTMTVWSGRGRAIALLAQLELLALWGYPKPC